jgi:VHL beta domain
MALQPRTVLAGLLLSMAALLPGGVATVTAGDEDLPDIHSSCQSEETRESTEGTAPATLTINNFTDAPFDLFWLDYDGERVSYQVSRPHSTQTQATWLTHPWVLADPQGTCYLLIVMTSVQQTMSIGTTTGEVLETPEPTPSAQPTDSNPAATAPSGQGGTDPVETEMEPGFPTPLVIAGLAMLGVLVGVLFATGKLFGGPKPGPRP